MSGLDTTYEAMSLTQDEAKAFKKTYEHAKINEEKTFFFKGKEFVTDFAKYLIEYYKL